MPFMSFMKVSLSTRFDFEKIFDRAGHRRRCWPDANAHLRGFPSIALQPSTPSIVNLSEFLNPTDRMLRT